MKKFAILDRIKNGDWFDRVIDAETQEQAIWMAQLEWDRLSTYDQNRREEFALVFGEVDEDRFIDLDTATDIKRFK